MSRYTAALLIGAALVFGTAGAQAATFTNGSFEIGNFVDGGPGFQTLGGGSTTITGWTVGGNSIDWIRTYWQPQSGSMSIDLDGNAPGSVSQTFDTVAGQQYLVTFWMAGNPDGAPTVKTLDALIDVALTSSALFDDTGATRGNMEWVQKSFTFTAQGTSSTLTFDSTTPGPYGPALDNVNVAAVPEASTWAMMVLGFLGVGIFARRRQVGRRALAC